MARLFFAQHFLKDLAPSRSHRGRYRPKSKASAGTRR